MDAARKVADRKAVFVPGTPWLLWVFVGRASPDHASAPVRCPKGYRKITLATLLHLRNRFIPNATQTEGAIGSIKPKVNYWRNSIPMPVGSLVIRTCRPRSWTKRKHSRKVSAAADLSNTSVSRPIAARASIMRCLRLSRSKSII